MWVKLPQVEISQPLPETVSVQVTPRFAGSLETVAATTTAVLPGFTEENLLVMVTLMGVELPPEPDPEPVPPFTEFGLGSGCANSAQPVNNATTAVAKSSAILRMTCRSELAIL